MPQSRQEQLHPPHIGPHYFIKLTTSPHATPPYSAIEIGVDRCEFKEFHRNTVRLTGPRWFRSRDAKRQVIEHLGEFNYARITLL